MKKIINLSIDDAVLVEYDKHYFDLYPRRKKRPIKHPYHESINEWMIMKRPAMNALKQKWKDFIIWFITKRGYANLRIEKCDMKFETFYPTNRRHDVDNSVPKFVLDGFCECGFLVDDDSKHLMSLLLKCGVDCDHPRTDITVYYEQEE